MDLDVTTIAVIAILAWVVVNVARGGRWNRETGRWERFGAGRPDAPTGRLTGVDLSARQDIEDLRRRVATLERLVTDPALRLGEEIDRLKDNRPPTP